MYIPHFPVFKTGSSTTPDWPVFNASATTKGGRSVNHFVSKGVFRQTTLSDIIMRWRMYPCTALGDTKKAFLQIAIRPEDKKYLRLLWYVERSIRIF